MKRVQVKLSANRSWVWAAIGCGERVGAGVLAYALRGA